MDHLFACDYDVLGRLRQGYPWQMLKEPGDTLTISGLRCDLANVRNLASRWRASTGAALSLKKVNDSTMVATLAGWDHEPSMPRRGRPFDRPELLEMKVGDTVRLPWARDPRTAEATNARALHAAIGSVRKRTGWKLAIVSTPSSLNVTRLA